MYEDETKEVFEVPNLQKVKGFLEKLILDLKRELAIPFPNVIPHHIIINKFYNFRVTSRELPYSFFTLKLFDDGCMRLRIVGKKEEKYHWSHFLDFLDSSPEEEIISFFPTLISKLEEIYWEPKRRMNPKPMTIVINRLKQFWEKNQWMTL